MTRRLIAFFFCVLFSLASALNGREKYIKWPRYLATHSCCVCQAYIPALFMRHNGYKIRIKQCHCLSNILNQINIVHIVSAVIMHCGGPAEKSFFYFMPFQIFFCFLGEGSGCVTLYYWTDCTGTCAAIKKGIVSFCYLKYVAF